MDDLSGFVSYDSLVNDILQQRGITVEEVSWRAPSVDWNRYDLVVQRSSWDYQQAPDDYLRVLAEIERSTARLENSLSIASWNIRKTYLRELQSEVDLGPRVQRRTRDLVSAALHAETHAITFYIAPAMQILSGPITEPLRLGHER